MWRHFWVFFFTDSALHVFLGILTCQWLNRSMISMSPNALLCCETWLCRLLSCTTGREDSRIQETEEIACGTKKSEKGDQASKWLREQFPNYNVLMMSYYWKGKFKNRSEVSNSKTYFSLSFDSCFPPKYKLLITNEHEFQTDPWGWSFLIPSWKFLR